MESVRKSLMLDDEEDKSEVEGYIEEVEAMCPDLSWEQRIWGFGGCVALASLLTFLGIIFLFVGSLAGFAVFYTLGNLLYLASTFFLVGPAAQFKKMGEEHRLPATIVFLSSMVLTLIFALALESGILALIFVIFQSLALAWYSLTYIPGGQTLLNSCCSMFLG